MIDRCANVETLMGILEKKRNCPKHDFRIYGYQQIVGSGYEQSGTTCAKGTERKWVERLECGCYVAIDAYWDVRGDFITQVSPLNPDECKTWGIEISVTEPVYTCNC
jgi:hypothetical protein